MPFTADEAFALLQRAHARDRLAHAYLLAGPVGSGKRALAGRLTGLLLGTDAPDFQHPDVHLVEPESRSRRILIDQIREIEHGLHMRSFLGGRKVGVIVDADRLNANAANSFLKTLEEPPSHSHLLLLTSQPEQMLETILSRCLELPLRGTAAPAATPLQARLLAALESATSHAQPGLVEAFGLVREVQTLLAEAKAAIQAETDAAFAGEERHYKNTTDARAWLEDREDFYKALVQSRYIAARDALLEVVDQWWADTLRQKAVAGDSALLDQPRFAAATAALAQRHTTAGLLKKTSALAKLRTNLAALAVPQEQLAIECAFLEAFSA